MQAALKGVILLGGQEKRKDRKIEKSGSEEKVVGFSSVSLFPVRKWEAVTQGGTRGIDHPTFGVPRELLSSKTGRTSETTGAFKIHSHKTRIT